MAKSSTYWISHSVSVDVASAFNWQIKISRNVSRTPKNGLGTKNYTNVSIYTQHHVLLPAQNLNLDYLSINLPVNCLSSQHSCFSSGVLAVLRSTRDFSLLLASSCVIDWRGAALTMQPGPCSALHLSEGASILPLFSTLSIFFPLQSFLFSETVSGRHEK